MESRAKWAERVAQWKSSGQTSRRFCEGKPFTAGGLRHWAYRLRLEQDGPSRELAVPVVRVVRVRSVQARGGERPAPQGDTQRAREPSAEALAIEFGSARISLPPRFDREALAAVLDVLAAREGGR